MNNESVARRIRRLNRTWTEVSGGTIGRTGFYAYLVDVYDFYADLREVKGRANKVRRIILSWPGSSLAGPEAASALCVIIYASCRENKRTRSRWSRALRFAWQWRKIRRNLPLVVFLEENGGVSGCAAKFPKA